jgi:tRNA-binding protein
MTQHRLDSEARPYDPAHLPGKNEVAAAQYFALDIRIGRVLAAEPFPAARDPALILSVDFGPHIGVLRTSAKIANYAPEILVGRDIVGVVNLPSKRIAQLDSQFLVLGGLEPDGTVRLLAPDAQLTPGSVVA